MDRTDLYVALFCGGLFALVIGILAWALIADSNQMEREKVAFYEACLMDRKSYDCDMQWRTYETAHNAELNAGIAVGLSAANVGKK